MLSNRDIFAEHLSHMVKFPTVSHVDENQMDFEPFYQFHEYLEKTYPLVHKTFEKQVIGRAALLYRWRAKESGERLPVLLAAHQDVVPEGDYGRWKYPPYQGVIADHRVYGRGALDCKSMIMGQFEALEALIAEGYEPKQDIYLAYGYNEEVGTTTECPSARLICEHLKAQGVRLGLVIDEGGEIVSGSTAGVKGLLGNIAVAEKGFASMEVYKTGKAGHLAMPGHNCVMADLARVLVKIADYPRPYRVTAPMAMQYKLLAESVDEYKTYYENIDSHMDWLIPRLEADPRTGAKFQTTLAMTMASGSPSTSSLPERVSVSMNLRLLEGDTVEGILKDFRELAGEESGVKIELTAGRNPSPASEIDMGLFARFQEALDQIYPDIQVVPVICIGGTDAFYYHPICDRVYRFSGGRRHPDNGPSHGYNEAYSLETIGDIPQFFYHFLRQF
ncbi:M20/M25/M40 family metallo-hydrolase [Enterocloster asparagiformis]|uniref:M20/M25/M40 family metallo-hydrolase n=1 Tax=Enterocloster asparagiformis TaxID=333367 RepID=UPI002A82BD7C|nr:M20/M25/M40 family metallo-hydrolase [Enterocloster asparagiformis]